MPGPKQRGNEQPSTYFVQDRSNMDELKRLQLQDGFMTSGMGGVLPEQPEGASFQNVMDVACGTGTWLIGVAKAYPEASQLVGIDISNKMIEYARIQAIEQGVSDRVEFQVIDALTTITLPENHFDLINQRFGASYLRTWDWFKLIQELIRVSKPGGVIRLVEAEMATVNNSPAATKVDTFFLEALYQAGHLFTDTRDGITSQLSRIIQHYGMEDVQTRETVMTPTGKTLDAAREDMRLTFKNTLPFLRKWLRLPDDFEELQRQALKEMQQPDFTLTGKLLTVWGKKPVDAVIDTRPITIR